ncbi:MAG: hypothetical protein P4L79_01850 [Legionella sp.]|uniref:hypothetical protein n=1 Tax=Legionella sp. TaxID=459 RepID=UPI00283BA32D|nr:hypothetical protein [Legionella sp.]
MNNDLKRIVLNLAKLKPADQRWVLKQLTPIQREQFERVQGHALLKEADKFRHLPWPKLPQKEVSLPEFCQRLSQEDPLYIAIILEQGQFSWEHMFLEACMQKQKIQEELTAQVHKLKSASKLYLFQQWQRQLSFSEQLEMPHGDTL